MDGSRSCLDGYVNTHSPRTFLIWQVLDLSRNSGLTGTIPRQLGLLHSLETMNFYR